MGKINRGLVDKMFLKSNRSYKQQWTRISCKGI